MTSGPDLAAGAARTGQALGLKVGLRWAAHVLTHSVDQRWVVRYRWQDRTGRQVAGAVAKTYPDQEGARTYAAMRALRELAAGSGRNELEVPEAFCWDPALRLLVMAEVTGDSYRELARDRVEVPRLRRAGVALAVLHSLPVPPQWQAPAGLAGHAQDICRPAPPALAGVRPDDAGRISRLYNAAVAGADSGAQAVPLHRDLHLGQLIASHGRVAVLDWDLHAAGDAALDLANLLVYLETRLGPGAAPMQAAVRAGYASVGDPAVLDRLAPYEVLAYLRMAAKRHRVGPAGGPLPVAELLRQAELRITSWRAR